MFSNQVISAGFQSLSPGKTLSYTNRPPLATWLHRLKDSNAQLMSWNLILQQHQFTVQHRAGRANGNADALSRAFSINATGVVQEKGGGV